MVANVKLGLVCSETGDNNISVFTVMYLVNVEKLIY